MVGQKGVSTSKSKQTLKTKSVRGQSSVTKTKNEKAETNGQAAEQSVKKRTPRTKKLSEANTELSKNKQNIHRAVASKSKQPRKKRGASKKQEPNMKRSISILLLGVVIVSIYAIFTDDLAVLSNTTKGILIVFLLFIGFNSLLIFLGYRLGLKRNKK